MVEPLIFLLLAIVIVYALVRVAKKNQLDPMASGKGTLSGQRAEAYFKAMFPELQPWFHPQKVAQYVVRRRARPNMPTRPWIQPEGFGAASAVFDLVKDRERVRLLDEAGNQVAEFFYEKTDDGAVLRVGPGKLTATTVGAARVRYWHPDREFKWKGNQEWHFVTRIADKPIETDDRGSRFSNDSSSSSGSAATSAAVATGAVLVSGAGGAFAGGGATEEWGDSASGSSDAPAY